MKTPKINRELHKFISEHRGGTVWAVTDVLRILLSYEGIHWDTLLLAACNAGFTSCEKLQGRRKNLWLRRIRNLHDAMEWERSRRLAKQISSNLKSINS